MAESEALRRYRDLEQQLSTIRDRHEGHESYEEDQLLDEMDDVWWTLTDEERSILNGVST